MIEDKCQLFSRTHLIEVEESEELGFQYALFVRRRHLFGLFSSYDMIDYTQDREEAKKWIKECGFLCDL